MEWPAGGGRVGTVAPRRRERRPCGQAVRGVAAWGYGRGVGMWEAPAAAGGVHGFPAGLTSFVGRAGPVREVAGLLGERRLVTVTGPGGVGKTRLAGQVARAVAGRFADGVWLAELAPAGAGAQGPGGVAAGMGAREQPGVPAGGVPGRGRAPQRASRAPDDRQA